MPVAQTFTSLHKAVISRDCICMPSFFFSDGTLPPNHNTMSVSVFANALRAHSRLRVLTATRVALPATRSISSLVAFRTAIPKNVSLSVSRSYTTSQVARYEYNDNAPKTPASPTVFVANIPWNATEEDISDIFSEFGKVLSVRLRGFFFPDRIFFNRVYEPTLDLNPDGKPRGICHVEYSDKEGAIAAVESASQEAIHLSGRDLRVDFSAGNRARVAQEPNEKLYFSGCAGDESEIRRLFDQYAGNIIDIHLCMLFTLSDSLPTTHMDE